MERHPTSADWRYVYRLMFADTMRDMILEAGLPEPVNERQVRPLNGLEKLELPTQILNELFRDSPEVLPDVSGATSAQSATFVLEAGLSQSPYREPVERGCDA